MADQPSRKRRIVRRTAIAIAVIVLLPVWYVATWLLLSHAENHRQISMTTAKQVRPAFIPLIRYAESKNPGAKALSDLWWNVNPETKGTFAWGVTNFSPNTPPPGFGTDAYKDHRPAW